MGHAHVATPPPPTGPWPAGVRQLLADDGKWEGGIKEAVRERGMNGFFKKITEGRGEFFFPLNEYF